VFVILIKFAGYVDWILVCNLCKFGKYICYNFRDITFFLGGYFFGAPCISQIALKFGLCRSIPCSPNFVPKWPTLLIWASKTFDGRLRPNG